MTTQFDARASRRSRRWQLTASALVAGMGLAACTTAGADGSDPAVTPESAASISMAFAKKKEWNPSAPLVIKAGDGKLTDVIVRDQRGRKVPGRYEEQHAIWRSTARTLAFDTKYSATARAVDDEGLPTREKTVMRTVKPKTTAYTEISPYGGSVVGVGMPIIVTFDQPVTRRAAIEQRLDVETKPAATGAWFWVNDQMIRWRPRDYWKSGTDVVVRSKLAGVNFGDGVWGDDDDLTKFRVGEELVSTVDIRNHKMTVRQNGSVIRKIPVTTGKSGWDTRVGTKVIMSKEREVTMDAATIDVDRSDPEYYRLDVEYAMRLTWSGEYLHAAPWSEDSQGDANVSHGCTGMSTEDAAWLYNISKPGDVVTYVNGHRQMEPWNGYTDWEMSWKDWKEGSALT